MAVALENSQDLWFFAHDQVSQSPGAAWIEDLQDPPLAEELQENGRC